MQESLRDDWVSLAGQWELRGPSPRGFPSSGTSGGGRGARGWDEETPAAFRRGTGCLQWSKELLPPRDDKKARFGSETAGW